MTDLHTDQAPDVSAFSAAVRWCDRCAIARMPDCQPHGCSAERHDR